jgi:hypothetical protein
VEQTCISVDFHVDEIRGDQLAAKAALNAGNAEVALFFGVDAFPQVIVKHVVLAEGVGIRGAVQAAPVANNQLPTVFDS